LISKLASDIGRVLSTPLAPLKSFVNSLVDDSEASILRQKKLSPKLNLEPEVTFSQ
jgi:hypothetical protein